VAIGGVPALGRQHPQPQQPSAFRAFARYVDQSVDLIDEVVHVVRVQKRVAIWVDAGQEGKPFVVCGKDAIKVAGSVEAASSRILQSCHHACRPHEHHIYTHTVIIGESAPADKIALVVEIGVGSGCGNSVST
jgi:hypothetical protein